LQGEASPSPNGAGIAGYWGKVSQERSFIIEGRKREDHALALSGGVGTGKENLARYVEKRKVEGEPKRRESFAGLGYSSDRRTKVKS